MARALATGFARADLTDGANIGVFDPIAQASEQFINAVSGAVVESSNRAVVDGADVIFLAIKPQSFSAVAKQLAGAPTEGKLFISILAGLPLQTLCGALGTDRVVRVMPNTPCLIGRGASGYAMGSGVTDEDGQLVEQLLSCVGVALRLDEPHLDAVTGLSGSGPAYVFTMIEALSDGGVRMGLPRAAATTLAAHTVLGAAQMVSEMDVHPAVLRDRVTSPGGTTIAGLQVLEQQGLRAALLDAVQAATERSRELGRSS